MTKIILLGLLIINSGGYLTHDSCKCRKPQAKPVAEEDEDKGDEDYVYKRLYGQVTGGLGPLEGILVEVYNRPEVALHPSMYSGSDVKKEIKQRKIASCKTGKDGMFCFKGIKPGKYEIRFTDVGYPARNSGPFDKESYFITLDPYHPESTDRMIEVLMEFAI